MSFTSETQETIFNYIFDNPGVHFRDIVNTLEREVGVVNYHINALIRSKGIIDVYIRNKRLFFAWHWQEEIDDVAFAINHLRNPPTRNIILLLSDEKTSELSFKEICSILQKSPSSLHFHVKKLVEDKVIVARKRDREVKLSMNIEKALVKRLGDEIYPTRWQTFLDDIDKKFR